MTDAGLLDDPGLQSPPPRPEPKRDHFGRYIIPDPITGEERTWTRATTWAQTVADTFALEKWALRQAALGLARRPDLLTGVAAVLDPETKEGKRKLDGFVGQAKEAAGATARATIGTALHSFVEAVDGGREVQVPAPFDKDIAAYREGMAGIKTSRHYLEQVCTVVELGVAGTMDRVVKLAHARLPMIGDVKTGRDLTYSWTEIAIQLALYAHADTIFDPSSGHRRMIEVDQDKALVVHLPAGEARCQLYIVDIAAGWEMAQVCGVVRAWRKRKDIAQAL